MGPLDVYDEHWQPVPSLDVCYIYPTSFALSSKRTQTVSRMGRDGGGVHRAHSGSILSLPLIRRTHEGPLVRVLHNITGKCPSAVNARYMCLTCEKPLYSKHWMHVPSHQAYFFQNMAPQSVGQTRGVSAHNASQVMYIMSIQRTKPVGSEGSPVATRKLACVVRPGV